MIAGARVTKIVVIQSLEEHEVRTGSYIKDHVLGLVNERGWPMPVELINIESAKGFVQTLNRLISDAHSKNEIPLIHVECHGDEAVGLEFANGSTIDWDCLSDKLVQLNVATKFNLTAIFSACYGGYFLRQIDACSASPCWCMVAPTATVDPGEIMAGFRLLYTHLIREGDLGSAVNEMQKLRLSSGAWFGESAERWYEISVVSYIREHCTHSIARARAQAIYAQQPKQGSRRSMNAILGSMRERNSSALINEYFDRFFLIDRLPENRARFNGVRTRIQQELAFLRKQGLYNL